MTHPCPVCGDQNHLSDLCTVDGFKVHACATCHAEHVWPMPTPGDLKAFYDRAEWFEGGEKGGYANYDDQTGWSMHLLNQLLEKFDGNGRAILDLGCGYGTHLAAAAQKGWRCFGVEPSAHARGVAQERLGEQAHIVPAIGDLFAHKFDVVLMFDVLEHLPSPYQPFYELFALGAIASDTAIVITTPNAASSNARKDPAGWEHRHPPSHLVYYTPETLEFLLRRLRFQEIEVGGVSPVRSGADLSESRGLMATAKGSDFSGFMQERYVPGTWSKIAAYEHVPRYRLAQPLVAGKTVLDFGCGTGYGAAMLAQSAARVTALDIDESALVWARATHRAPNLDFVRHDDLGESLHAASFDVITCFEMIEHVDFATQQQAVASFARLLRDDGVLFISTPNPEVTKLYGANPYHIREMTEAELRDLLSPHFPLLRIMRQQVRPGVTFSREGTEPDLKSASLDVTQPTAPMAFIAVAARHALPDVPDVVFFDDDLDYVSDFMAQARHLQSARASSYTQTARARSAETQYQIVSEQRDGALNQLAATRNELAGTVNRLNETTNAKNEIEGQLQRTAQHLDAVQRQREEELSSPRFLARKLREATSARLKKVWRARVLGQKD